MNDTKELQFYFCPFGILDLQKACEIGDEVGITEEEIFEVIDEFKDSCGYLNFENIDPVACLLEHILQMARNEIESVSGYDFLNDFSGIGSEIYTQGNFMCSQYDYGAEAIEELKRKTLPHLNTLYQNKWCRYFLNELEIGL